MDGRTIIPLVPLESLSPEVREVFRATRIMPTLENVDFVLQEFHQCASRMAQDARTEKQRASTGYSNIQGIHVKSGFPRGNTAVHSTPGVSKGVNIHYDIASVANATFNMGGTPSPPTPVAAQQPVSMTDLSTHESLTRPLESNSPSPWLPNQPHHVVNVAELMPSKNGFDININPWLSSTIRPYPLQVDLRARVDSVCNMPGPGNTLKRWHGHQEPATLPVLDQIFIVAPLLHKKLVVDNKNGVTCGDVIHTLYKALQIDLNREDWDQLDPPQQDHIKRMYHYHRKPTTSYSQLRLDSITPVDLLFDNVCFVGLRSDPAYVQHREGWNNPACFVAEFDRLIRG